jgi:hypothetical protein
MDFFFHGKIDFEAIVKPETALESKLLQLPEFQAGYDWGLPRFGHPEGKTGLHVREVLDNVERLEVAGDSRELLRLVAIAHDTFKFREGPPGNRPIHHGLLARQFLEARVNDPVALDLIELHDEAFYIWRWLALEKKEGPARQRFERLLQRLGGNLPLYCLFFKCDTETGDKIQAPLRWLRQQVAEVGVEF